MAFPSVTPYLAGLAAKIDGAVSADDLTKAETCLLDWCAVALAAADDPLMRLMRAQAADEGGHPQAGFLGSAARGSAQQAALINGTASHLYDYDDGATSIPGHPTVPVGSAVWALGEREKAPGRAVLTAFILGVEVMCRLGRALKPGHYAAGWHASGTLGAIGAAVACAKLLGLDAERTAWTIGLAACRASGLKAVFGSSAKPLQLGHAAALGLQSADLAARGFDCTPDVLEKTKGFLELHAPAFNPEPILAPLAAPLAVREVRFKRHAACFLTHAPAEASLAFKRQHNDAVEAIKRIRIVGNPEVRTVCGNWTPESGLALKFSAPMVVAATLSGVDTGALATFSDDTARDAKLRALAAKVEIESDAGFDQEEATLTFELHDGQTVEIEGLAAWPATDVAADRAALLPKVRALLRPIYGDGSTEAVIFAFAHLHAQDAVPDLWPALQRRKAAE